MSYSYQEIKPQLFTEYGQKTFLAIRDKTLLLLKEAGACRAWEMWRGQSGSTDVFLACIDRLVELGEIVPCQNPRSDFGQHHVFVASDKTEFALEQLTKK